MAGFDIHVYTSELNIAILCVIVGKVTRELNRRAIR